MSPATLTQSELGASDAHAFGASAPVVPVPLDDAPLLYRVTRPLRPEEYQRIVEQLSSGHGRNVLPDIEVREVERANPLWRGPISTLTDENRAVRLLLACGAVVEGWMSRRFLGRATFWTWDPPFARITNFLVGETPRILPGVVEPVAWTELEGDEGE
jgi:hypothetical protein